MNAAPLTVTAARSTRNGIALTVKWSQFEVTSFYAGQEPHTVGIDEMTRETACEYARLAQTVLARTEGFERIKLARREYTATVEIVHEQDEQDAEINENYRWTGETTVHSKHARKGLYVDFLRALDAVSEVTKARKFYGLA